MADESTPSAAGWGWHDPERQARAREASSAELFERAQPFGVLVSPQGRQVLQQLRAMTYLASSGGPPGLTPEAALYKEAQSNLVRWIEGQVAIAAAGPPAPATEPETERE